MNSFSEKYVFVSYSRKDQSRVLPIVESLRHAGATVWIDQEGIDGASFWAEEIVNAIRGCTLFLFMVSENSVDSSNTNRELALAAERNLPILPIYLTKAELPPRTAYQLAGIHYIEMLDGPTDRAIKTVLQAFQRAGVKIGTSPLRSSPPDAAVPESSSSLPSRSQEVPFSPPPATAPQPPHMPQERTPRLVVVKPSGQPCAVRNVVSIIEDPFLFRETPMGRLFLGRRQGIGKVVLKVLSQIPPETLEWLKSDMYRRVMGNRLIDMGTLESGETWILMRHVDAQPLSDLVRPGNVIVGALLDDIILSIMEQLSVLHGAQRPVIHRDVTPGNLMITFNESANEEAKTSTQSERNDAATDAGEASRAAFKVHLMDYEAACFADSAQTPVGAGGFASPEQIKGKAVPASDLYSLLATAFFLATGKLPPNLARPGVSPVKIPRDAWGTGTRLEEEYGYKHLETCWSPNPSDRPLSAQHFLSEVVVPITKCFFPPTALGVFCYRDNWQVMLYDKEYFVRKRA